MEKIIKIIVAIIALFLFGELLMYGLNKQEIHECLEWRRDSYIYESFYMSDWQSEQCNAHDIFISTKVI